MQTFLPYRSFEASAACLDYRRLGKQRSEALTIYKILMAPPAKQRKMAWVNHPAVKMWREYEKQLAWYYNCALNEWIRRGYNNSMQFIDVWAGSPPPWLTDEFCSRHRAALLAKEPDWYRQFGWTEEPRIKYIWPV